MRKFVIGINLAVLALVLFGYGKVLVDHSRHNDQFAYQGERFKEFEKPFEWGMLGLFTLFAAYPVSNLIFIVGFAGASGNGVMSLYFQRRAAEERARIRKLDSDGT